ncbi:MAG: HU family DNA-binding protein [Fusobacteriales bacterium]|jgi:hypothetical protein|nr:HU family DNA-binding protein [Fusobacteriales bacterium]
MNKTEIAGKVSERSGVEFEECRKVIDAFEKVLEEELTDSKGLGGVFDQVYNVMSFFKGRKRRKKLKNYIGDV